MCTRASENTVSWCGIKCLSLFGRTTLKTHTRFACGWVCVCVCAHRMHRQVRFCTQNARTPTHTHTHNPYAERKGQHGTHTHTHERWTITAHSTYPHTSSSTRTHMLHLAALNGHTDIVSHNMSMCSSAKVSVCECIYARMRRGCTRRSKHVSIRLVSWLTARRCRRVCVLHIYRIYYTTSDT